MKRLFIAGELDEGSAEQLESQIQRFRTTFAREAEAVRWVARERYHLTLVFLGDTEERQIPGVREILGQCGFPGIPELRIGPPIVFPRPSSPGFLREASGQGQKSSESSPPGFEAASRSGSYGSTASPSRLT